MASGTQTFLAEEYYATDRPINLGTLSTAAEYTSKIRLFRKSSAMQLRRWTNIIFQYVITLTSTNAVIRIQGSLDGDNWFNVDAEEKDITITASGTYSVTYEGKGEINYIRLYFVSESGGTDATIAVKAKVY